MSADDIDDFVVGLSQRLRGPRRIRADLVAEARDGLVDAVEAYLSAGLCPAEASRRALDDFGGYHDVVPDYQAELAVAQGRRTMLLIAVALPLLVVTAPLMWWHSPWAGHAQLPVNYARLTVGFDVLSVAGAALAVLVLVGYGWGSRYIRDGVRLTQVVGWSGLTFLLVHGISGVAIYLWSLVQWPQMLFWPPVWAGAVMMGLAFDYAALSVWRCLAVTRVSRSPVVA